MFHLPIAGIAAIYDDGTLEFRGKAARVLKDTSGLGGLARTLDVEVKGKLWRLYTDQPVRDFTREQVLDEAARSVAQTWRDRIDEMCRRGYFEEVEF